MGAAEKTFPQGKFFRSKEELVKELQVRPIVNALILIKASRGMALEKLVEFI